MSKVDWSAKQDFQFIANYKVLQAGFNKNHIDKVFSIFLDNVAHCDILRLKMKLSSFSAHRRGPAH